VTSLSSEEMLEIQSKDINEQTIILCKFFAKVFLLIFVMKKSKKYVKNKYPTRKELSDLAEKTQKTVRSIETWFKNRRRSMANRGLMPDYTVFKLNAWFIKIFDYFKEENNFQKKRGQNFEKLFETKSRTKST